MQVTLPTTMLRQITREAFAHQNMTCIAAIHHSTRDIDSYSGNVFERVRIPDVLHRPAVDSHPYRQARLRAQGLADSSSALGRPLHRTGEDESHTVAGWRDTQPPRCFCFTRCLRIARNALQLP